MVVGVDVGGTKCWAVATTLAGELVNEYKVPTPTSGALVDVLVNLCHVVVEPGHQLIAFGIGAPGPVDRAGVLHTAAHIPSNQPLALGKELTEQLEVPVAVDNDATFAALAEHRMGAGRGINDMMFISFGTGIGAGLVMDGEVRRGAHGYAGEPGHTIMVPDGRECACGRFGCWERYASGTAVALHAQSHGLEAKNGAEVYAAALQHHPAALMAFQDHGHWAGEGLAQLTAVLDPARYVLGGGMVNSAELWLDHAREAHRKAVFGQGRRPEPEMVPALLGARAGALGAALAAADLVS